MAPTALSSMAAIAANIQADLSATQAMSMAMAYLIIGAPRAAPNGNSGAGKTYILYGQSNQATAGNDRLTGSDQNDAIDPLLMRSIIVLKVCIKVITCYYQ
jgi:hypothetical protein